MVMARAKRHENSTPPRKTGPPSTITDELTAEIAGYVRDGSALLTAAQLAGVAEDTFKSWMRLGRKGQEPQRTFRAVLVKAKAEVEHEVASRLKESLDWRAQVEWLRRRNPQQWEPRQKTDARVTLKGDDLTDDEVRAALAKITARVGT